MNILAFTPQSRVIPRALQSQLSLQWNGRLTHVFMRGGDVSATQHTTCFQKCVQARRMALEGGYDALFLLDDDIIVLPDALIKLASLGVDIAYGLYVMKWPPHSWNATHHITDHTIELYGTRPGDTRAAWGRAIPVHGHSTACTLIARHVLETIPFQRRGIHAQDWYMALDAARMGYRQVCDTTVQCGHVDDVANLVYWPTSDGYRTEPF